MKEQYSKPESDILPLNEEDLEVFEENFCCSEGCIED